jgi:hypothetical protein
VLLLVGSSLPLAACGDEPATPTSPSTEDVATTRLFTGTLAPGGSTFYSFTVPQASDVSLTLASVTPVNARPAAPVALDLGLGVPRGTGCAVSSEVVVEADLAAQIREARPAGVHCVAVADAGQLAGEVAFAVRIGYFQ